MNAPHILKEVQNDSAVNVFRTYLLHYAAQTQLTGF